MRTNKIMILLSLVTLFSTSSCFREYPNDKIAETNIWKSPILLDGYVAPWYRNMSYGFSFYMPSLALAKSETREYLPWYADQIIISKSDWYVSAYGDLMKGEQTQSQLSASRTWSKWYTQIRSINFLLQNADKIADGDQKTRILGEAHFFRGYYYYQLFRRFGGVLLLTEPYNPLESPVKYPRASTEEMVNFITNEAQLAAGYLKSYSGAFERGRVTQGAALMLKAKTYFWASGERLQLKDKAYLGFPDDRTRPMLEAACREYEEVMKLGYELTPITPGTQAQIADQYRAIFTTKFGKESILEVNHSDNGDFADAFGHKLDREAASPFFTGTTAANVPTENHYNEYRMVNGMKRTDAGSGFDPAHRYEGLDYRFYANVLYDGSTYNGHVMDIHHHYEGETLVPGVDLTIYGSSEKSAFTATGYYLAKFRKETQKIDNDATFGSSQNYIIWRYAELLLDYAEAKYLLGETGEALNRVNEVRRRAQVGEWTSMTLDDLYNERRIELAFEEVTYWDILRRNQGELKLSYRTPIRGVKVVLEKNGTYSYTPFDVHPRENFVRNFSERQYLFCIPWDDIRYHRLEQNPGYIEY